jgi:hypothetical protein
MVSENPDWRPWHIHHGSHRRIFCPLEDLSVFSFIQANFTELSLVFTGSGFRKIEIKTFCTCMRTLVRLLRRFNARPDSSLPSKHAIGCLRGEFTTNAGQL